jgi:carbon dioxide concentrating mechanism protein CcmN
MQSLSLELIDDCHIYISGDVIVHPSAAIAPGVLLQADPGCRLIVAAGVCIGQGSVLHAHQGWLEVDSGVTIGSGVLVVGQGKIGANACIGALTTVINSSVEPNQLVPSGSLVGEMGRQVSLEQAASSPAPTSPATPPPVGSAQPAPQTESSETPESPEKTGLEPPAQKTLTQVYGQAYVERIMITMFPHRRLLNNSPPEPPP